jgi:two-component system response regulator RpaA
MPLPMPSTPKGKATIMVVDDDPAILQLLRMNLEFEGYQVVPASNAIDGMAKFRSTPIDLAILDIMMPQVSGIALLQQLRQLPQGEHLPVMLLTALGETQHKVEGFRRGADDYMVKPFEVAELLARVEALLRRASAGLKTLGVSEPLQYGVFTLIPDNYEVKLQDTLIKLTPTEYDILARLVAAQGQTVSLQKIAENVWGYNVDESLADTLRVHIRHLRTKLDKASPVPHKYIETIYGGGYRLHATLPTV